MPGRIGDGARARRGRGRGHFSDQEGLVHLSSPATSLLSSAVVSPYGAVSQGSARPGWSRTPVISMHGGRAVLTRFPRCRLKARPGVHHEHSTDALATVKKAQFVSCEGRGPPLESAFSAKCAASGPELGLGQERVKPGKGNAGRRARRMEGSPSRSGF